MTITVNDLKHNHDVTVYLTCSTEYLSRLGFTEHGLRHAGLVSSRAFQILNKLGYQERDCQLAAVAGYLHDVANMVNRFNHGGIGAAIAHNILANLGMAPEEIALVISAIGNHEEERGHAVNHVASALILADKSDVHRSRVTTKDFAKFEIHDRVNYAAHDSNIAIDSDQRIVTLDIMIDTKICPIMEYFEIFLDRMVMSRRAAEYLDCTFQLVINQNRLH